MLYVSWPELHKIRKSLEKEHNLKDDSEVTFRYTIQDRKTHKKKLCTVKRLYKDFLKMFWELCENPYNVLDVLVLSPSDSSIYQYKPSHIEQMPTGGNPHVLQNWNRLTPIQKEAWLKITIAQIDANA